ncbi:HSP20-like chaperones superfamily protein [Actinidia rufa]|uniref:HSP20-like chaperones superfamily protein n=1 Tax=Actinidia rufa TaxID=165716 RepID=A0A7J0F9D2_9ERIC|nr:HSP20-like chaperones superfamily protein [Actinidia rufa]
MSRAKEDVKVEVEGDKILQISGERGVTRRRRSMPSDLLTTTMLDSICLYKLPSRDQRRPDVQVH